MIPASLAVVLADTPPERRAAAIGAWSAAGALAAAAGPAIGGVLVDQVGWRALFVINVPLGLAILYGARAIPAGGGKGGLPDALGTLLLGAGIGAAALGISQGRDLGLGRPAHARRDRRRRARRRRRDPALAPPRPARARDHAVALEGLRHRPTSRACSTAPRCFPGCSSASSSR